jgi:hypothetical protein
LPLSVIFCFAYVVAERGEIGPLRFGGGGLLKAWSCQGEI